MEAYERRGGSAPYDGLFLQSGCVYLYQAWDRYALHTLGLTDAILGRTDMESDRPAHKLGLIPLADDLAIVLREVRGRPERGDLPRGRRGGHRGAVDRGEPRRRSKTIERKIYNRHDWRREPRPRLHLPRADPGRRAAVRKGPDDAP